jgi:hypothetical protein
MELTKMKWHTADGRILDFNDIPHQHLSNIIWFNRVFRGYTRMNYIDFELNMVLQRNYNGVLLPWLPLPIEGEIKALIKMGLILNNGSIIGNQYTPLKEGKVIGSITHINNWKMYLKVLN